MRNGGAADGHVDQVLLAVLIGLADGFGHFLGLAHAYADAALFIADHDQRHKAHVAAALHGFGNAVDSNQSFLKFALGLFAAFTFSTLHCVLPPS